MNNKELVAALAEKMRVTQKEASALLGVYVEEVQKSTTIEQPVSFLNVGSFDVKMREQRLSVNPKTKKRLLVPPKMVLNFTPNSAFKSKIKKLESNE